jgi:hypothetical protein
MPHRAKQDQVGWNALDVVVIPGAYLADRNRRRSTERPVGAGKC